MLVRLASKPYGDSPNERGCLVPARRKPTLEEMMEIPSRLSTVVPEELHKQVKVAAAISGRSVQEIVSEAIAEWLDAHK